MKAYQKLCKRTRGFSSRGEYKRLKRKAERRERKRLLKEVKDHDALSRYERRVYFGWDD